MDQKTFKQFMTTFDATLNDIRKMDTQQMNDYIKNLINEKDMDFLPLDKDQLTRLYEDQLRNYQMYVTREQKYVEEKMEEKKKKLKEAEEKLQNIQQSYYYWNRSKDKTESEIDVKQATHDWQQLKKLYYEMMVVYAFIDLVHMQKFSNHK